MNCIYCHRDTKPISFGCSLCQKCNCYLAFDHGYISGIFFYGRRNQRPDLFIMPSHNKITIRIADSYIDRPLEWIFPQNLESVLSKFTKLQAFA